MSTQIDQTSGVTSERSESAIYKHILLPVDFSDPNIEAAEYAREIAGWGDTQITLLHVTATEAGIAPEEAHIAGRLSQVLGGAGVQYRRAPGHPADVISQYAADNGVDLIVMATRGVSAVRRVVLGSVTAKVLKDAACPVLTFVSEDVAAKRKYPRFRHIACALDLRDDSLRVLNAAKPMAKRSGAPLSILHVSPQLQPVIGVVHDREWRNFLAGALRAEIEELTRDAGIEATVNLAGGEAAATIAQMVADLKADVLVIGRPRPRGLLGRLRAHSYAIISEAPCPVMSV